MPCWKRRWSCADTSSASPSNAARCPRAARSPKTMSSRAGARAADPDASSSRSCSRRARTRSRSTASCSGRSATEPCSGCTHFLDAVDGAALHAAERINFVVVAKSPLKRLLDLAKQRGWKHLRLLSTAGNTYDRDYYGDSTALSEAMRDQQEFKPGEEWDMPILNVFRREEDGTIRHFWALGAAVRAGRARPGVSPQRSSGPAVEHVRRHAGGPRRLRSEGPLLIALMPDREPGGPRSGKTYRKPTGTTLIEFCGLPSMMRSV